MRLNSLLIIILFSIQIFSQEAKTIKENQATTRGNEIIENARQSINSNKLSSDFTSFQILTKNQDEDSNIFETGISLIMPGKIITIYSTIKPFEAVLTSIWNGEKYKKLSEIVTFDGKRIVQDQTNLDTVKILSTIVKDEKKLETLKKAASVDPKARMKDQLWSEVFPFILIHPLEKQAEFKFVGKAKAGDVEVNVIDTTTENGHLIRLFFDAETNYLLKMTEKYQYFDGDYERNYYYSERGKVDGILIPKKIKVEHKFTPIGEETRTSYIYTDVVEFKINPKLKPELFKID